MNTTNRRGSRFIRAPRLFVMSLGTAEQYGGALIVRYDYAVFP